MHGTYIEIIHENQLGFSGYKMLNTKEIEPLNETATDFKEKGAPLKKIFFPKLREMYLYFFFSCKRKLVNW